MKNPLFLLAFFLALFVASCKPTNKEVTEAPKLDTMAVTPAPKTIVIDSASVAALYNEERSKAPAKSQNPYKSEKGKMKKVDTEPVILSYGAATDTTAGSMDVKGVYYNPTKWASFPGGEAALDKFFDDNLKYPFDALDNNIEGTVYADLIVDASGNIGEVNIISKHIGYGLETEVLRVIKLMPRWNPGEYKGQAVKTKFTLPVVFDLK